MPADARKPLAVWPVLRSRILPPPPGVVPRPDLLARLEPPHLLALIAGPGFGKSQLLAAWASSRPVAWLTLAPGEEDPHSLLVYLLAALREAGRDFAAASEVLKEGAEGGRWRQVVDHLLASPSELPLVLDEVHFVGGACLPVLDYLLRYAPFPVRLAGRSFALPTGRMEVWGAAELALTRAEVEAMGASWEATGGWPMAVDSQLRLGTVAPASELSGEIWQHLSEPEQEFLLRASVLEFLSEDACRSLMPEGDRLLRQLAGHGVIITEAGEGHWRLHPLFREHLQAQAAARRRLVSAAHRRAAQAMIGEGLVLEAVPHLLAGGRRQQAGQLLEVQARELLDAGSHRKLIAWVEELEPAELAPGLQLAYAEALGRASRFEQAVSVYDGLATFAHSAGDFGLEALSLTSAGKLCVATLQPARAGDYLRHAYRLSAEEARPELLELLAENYLNQGRLGAARKLRERAGDGAARLDARLLLRMGKFGEARAACLAGEGVGHQQGQLILAYVSAVEGEAHEAERRARGALAAATDDFTRAVAWMRLGHALQLVGDGAVDDCYRQALELTETTGVERLRAEALMGQALWSAAREAPELSYGFALDGLDLARQAGDEWMAGWLRLVAGIAAAQGGHPEAASLLAQGGQELTECGDEFGQVLARLWMALDRPEALPTAAFRAREAGYGFLLERPTLFGPRGMAAGGFGGASHSDLVDSGSASSEPLALPAGARVPSLRLSVLGPLRLWRDGVEVDAKAFKRRKARELLAYLLHVRGGFASKDQLCERLFPDSTPKAAVRDLRVALHALFQVLDPERPHNATARNLQRREDLYALPWEGLSLDVADFETAVERGDSAEVWQRALALYRGEYLEDFPYAEWAQDRRAQLRTLYLTTAERVGRLHLEAGREEAALGLAHDILSRDRAWEGGYQLLMRCHLAAGRPSQAARAYDQCVEVLKEELGVEPSEATEELYARSL